MSKAVPSASGATLALVTSKTQFSKGGEKAACMARECTFNIDPLADMLIQLADNQQMAQDLQAAPSPAVLRMLGCRIKELNSVLMSYLCDDGISMDDAHTKIYSDAIPFEGEADHG
ncbi:hypothetical protein EJP67_02255 [Variovorax guangxiensis]|uniref:Uncharacterized protein n=1 Tax=Variovorax guangxiensis TaxID=1775474 RepID=A0A433MDD9_9BURK|nr:hypothetical protein [Variovorax guangxiensis]RUR65876.1 hypothetical protein EJP67_02255 [Variovorax guangxiensis]